ncbi:unnamed protein product (macronuclear) [Paramecium tetraurelia]|uniref:Uncharacterized protein n=1 Tax=Paramecium tetraurelia TaxID=5888 RepID=A0BR13_PARTE|nr:uncharacterized protein GSPATT00031209001 [Paramecium tetraurelia]CAK60980.1 unnamed protein product [Paramecium tetraurelia]|eukprot:XP_001428378.1 hypothetical protein (macronuclear) [Paramecium tetraurelia strain d4-2]
MEDLLDICVERQFHDVNYIININANVETLNIEIESKQSGDSWIANFQAQYIEDIASKTGNYKKYATFIKMLQSALNNQTETVYIDILTYQDLEQIKNKRSNKQPTQNLAPNNKRYLILSYVVEFDKVHYPLPLNFNEQPNLQQMKNTIIRLRKENESLHKNLQFYKDQKRNESNPSILLNEQIRELEMLRNIIDQKESEILELKNMNHQYSNTMINRQEYNDLRSKYLQSENTNSELSKKMIEFEDYLQQLIDENVILKNQDKKNKQRINSLESELQQTLNKSKSKYNSNLSRSPSVSKSNNKQKNQLNTSNIPSKRKSIEKTTPIRLRKDSLDSDTESSYRRKSNSKRTEQSPSARSSSSKKKSFQPKQSNSKLQKNKNVIKPSDSNKFEDSEEQRLIKRLRDLREKNKENTIITTPQSKIEATTEDLQSIDVRLNKLNTLLQLAKNQ